MNEQMNEEVFYCLCRPPRTMSKREIDSDCPEGSGLDVQCLRCNGLFSPINNPKFDKPKKLEETIDLSPFKVKAIL